MASFNMQTAVEMLKRLYPDGIEEILYKKSPAWGMVQKWKGFGGEAKFLVWKFATGGGASTQFGVAQANKGASSFGKPLITRVKEYALASMDGEFQDASVGSANALAEAFKVAMDDALYNITRSLSFHAFRDGGGSRGQLAATASGVGTATIQLTANASMQGFEKNMWIQAASDTGAASPPAGVRAGRAQILSVDRVAKTLTTTANWSALITGIADGDYLFREGDYGNVIKGFEAWLPTAAPTAGDNFFGLDRSQDPTRLAGIRYAPTSGSIEEVLVAASAIAFDHGAEPDLVILNPLDKANLVNQIGSKRTIPIDAKSADKPTIGYKGVQIDGAAGPLVVLADPMCQRYKAWMLTQDSWEDWCLGEVPKVLRRDGQETLREANADADELRVGGYLQRVCTNPGANVNITLPSS